MPKRSKPLSPEAEALAGNNGKSAPGEWDGVWNTEDPISLHPGEPYVAHSVLLDYASLWPHGTLAQLAQRYLDEAAEGEAPKCTAYSIGKLSHRYRWRDRLARYEELRFKELEAERLRALAGVRAEREELATDLLKAGGGLVKWLNEALELGRKYPGTLKIKPSEVAAVAKAAVQISLLVHGGSAEEARDRLTDETAMQLVDALHASFRQPEEAVEGEYREVPMITGGDNGDDTAVGTEDGDGGGGDPGDVPDPGDGAGGPG